RSGHGRDARAFQLRYRKRVRAATLRNPVFFILLMRACAAHGLNPVAPAYLCRRLASPLSLRLQAIAASRARAVQVRHIRQHKFDRSRLMKSSNIPRKTRPKTSVGRIDSLPNEQREQIIRWLGTNLTYAQVAARITEQLGVTISIATLCAYACAHRPEISRPARVRSIIGALPAEQREAVHELFLQNLSYKQIAERARGQFGVRVSTSVLCAYYYSHHSEIFGALKPPAEAAP